MNDASNRPPPERIFPVLLLALPFAGSLVAHFVFAVALQHIGLVALVCLVLGGLYHVLWKSTESRPSELAVVFLIGEAIGAATLVSAFIRLFAS